MECPMCYDIYDEQQKIPRNLLCGHTYCEECLVSAIKNKGRLECPICRLRHDNRLKPNQLTKNYIALQFSIKHRELLQKHEFCAEHKQPLKFYCENDSQYICIDCITKHTGHRFFKQEQSIVLMKKKLGQKVSCLKQEQQRIKGMRSKYDSALVTLTQRYEQSLGQAEKIFNKFRKDLTEAEDRISADMRKFYENEVTELDRSKSELDREGVIVQKEIKVMEDKMESLQKIKMLEQKTEISEYKPKKFKNPLNNEFPTLTFTYMQLPRLQLNYRINPKICFFGDRKRLLMYCPNTNTYDLSTLVTQIQIQYYSACCTLPSGEIIITGGGSSNITLLFNAWAVTKLACKRNMISCRKEHSCVYMNGLVYALSGYDSKNKCMAGCEVYDINKDEWKSITAMNVPRCAFAVAVIKNRIWVMGGFNGIEQIKSVEVYEQGAERWKTVNVELKMPLANAAAVAYQNGIIVLGGGCNEGFSLQAYQIDLEAMTIIEISRMDTGRDLRNKAIMYNGDIYAVGGNNYSAERYRLRDYKWQPLRGYGDRVQDNLDSWCCGLTFHPSQIDLDKFGEYNNSLKKKYLDYSFNDAADNYDEMI